MTEEEGIVMSDLHIGKLTLTIPITKALMFKSKIIIYYITEDGETVASTMEFEVEECFENQVCVGYAHVRYFDLILAIICTLSIFTLSYHFSLIIQDIFMGPLNNFFSSRSTVVLN